MQNDNAAATWMRDHAARVLYLREFETEVNVKAELVKVTGVRFVPVAGGVFGEEADSVILNERLQCDTIRLPCGARTLMLSTRQGNDILFRGINKFFDYSEIDESVVLGALPSVSTVWLQRKIAGFVVHLWSEDGRTVRFASKHQALGPHVERARAIWNRRHTPQETDVAQWLCQRRLALSGECVDAAFDGEHPFLDEAFDGRIVFFSAHRYQTVAEETLPFSIFTEQCRSWGLDMVPSWRVHTQDVAQFVRHLHFRICLGGAVQIVDAAPLPETGATDMPHIAEGFVLMIEIPNALSDAFVIPLRIKIKTASYILFRLFRTCLEQRRTLSMPSSCRLFADEFVKWIEADATRRTLPFGNMVFSFLTGGVSSNQRMLLRQAVAELASRAVVKHTVVLLCGPPGTGKTTFATALVDHLGDDQVKVLSRDHFTRLRQEAHTSASLTRCRRVKLNAASHVDMLKALRAALASLSPLVIVLDACHATRAARQFWMSAVGSFRHCRMIVKFAIPAAAELARRVATRPQHPLFTGPLVADTCVSSVLKIWDAPTPEEARNYEALLLEESEAFQHIVGAAIPQPQELHSTHRIDNTPVGTTPKCDTFERLFVHPRHIIVAPLSTAVEELWRPALLRVIAESIVRLRQDAGLMLRGHGRWIEAFLKAGAGAPAVEIQHAIATVYTIVDDSHVTLQHPNDPPTSASMDVWQAVLNERVVVLVKSCLMDRNAVAVQVELPQCIPVEHAAYHHITVALRRRACHKYCKEMPQLFEELEAREVSETSAKIARTEVQTRVGMLNFAQFRLITPLSLQGTVLEQPC